MPYILILGEGVSYQAQQQTRIEKGLFGVADLTASAPLQPVSEDITANTTTGTKGRENHSWNNKSIFFSSFFSHSDQKKPEHSP